MRENASAAVEAEGRSMRICRKCSKQASHESKICRDCGAILEDIPNDSVAKTVEMIRQRFVECGFQETLDGKKREKPPTEKLLDGEQEAKIIATRLGPPPKGYANWTLRLLARKVVELEIVDAVSYETVRRTLKKRNDES